MIVTQAFSGRTGLITDQDPHDLPLEAWSGALNVNFALGRIERAPYWKSVRAVTPTAHGLFFVAGPTQRYWALASTGAVYSLSDLAETDITRAVGGAYTGTDKDPWTGGMFQGNFVLNNGVDVPQFWNLIAGAATLANLPNWPGTVRARVFRPFKEFLFALDVIKSGVRDRRLVKWSHPADPQDVPISWDEADPTKDAGEVSLGEGEDGIVDATAVGDLLLIGTQTQTWAARFVGGQSIFAFRRVFGEVGLLTTNCVASFNNRVFQLSADDILVHDFQSVQSISPDRVKTTLFNYLTPSNFNLVRIVRKLSSKEVWICVPVGDSLRLALVWNWEFNTWTWKDLASGTLAVANGLSTPVAATSVPWGSLATTWASTPNIWDEITLSQSQESLAAATKSPNSFYLQASVDVESTADSWVERRSLPIKPAQGREPVLDHASVAIIKGFWPKILADPGTSFEISIGTQLERDSPVVWGSPKIYTVGTKTNEVGFFASYRYLSLRIRCTTPSKSWRLVGYDLDIEHAGGF